MEKVLGSPIARESASQTPSLARSSSPHSPKKEPMAMCHGLLLTSSGRISNRTARPLEGFRSRTRNRPPADLPTFLPILAFNLNRISRARQPIACGKMSPHVWTRSHIPLWPFAWSADMDHSEHDARGRALLEMKMSSEDSRLLWLHFTGPTRDCNWLLVA